MVSTVITLALVCASLVALAGPASAAVGTTDLAGGETPTHLATTLAGEGITVSNVMYTGANAAAGSFTGGDGIIGLNDGVVLSSGDVAGVVGPNDSASTTTVHNTAGDGDLSTLVGSTTSDAAVLQFEFVPTTSQVQFSYVFSSEEYNEYVNEGFNDVFGFYINGTNCAEVGDPAVPVSIDTINAGSNASLFIDNDFDGDGSPLDTEMDGLTVVLTCAAPVTAGVENTMKLAIADTGDSSLDSAVFLGQNSFVAVHSLSVARSGDGSGTVTSDPAGIDCGEDCSEGYEAGTSVTLTATPDEGSVFGGWSGACTGLGTCQVAMDGTQNVVATFDPAPPQTHTLTVVTAGDGSGTVTSDPPGIDCGEDCAEGYEEGTVVTLTASPNEDSVLGGWSDPACEAAPTCQVTLAEATTVTVTFTASCPAGTDCDAGALAPGEELSTVEGTAGNPVSPADPFAIELTNVTNQTLAATIIEERCDGTQEGDALCSAPRVGGSAGNFQFSPEAAALGSDNAPVTVGQLYFDKSVIAKKAPVRILYQKIFGATVRSLKKCSSTLHTECYRLSKLASGDQIVYVPFKFDPRITRG
jgi:hypothetical protein